jgi:uncharacterized protein YigE (DUF2233 family)
MIKKKHLVLPMAAAVLAVAACTQIALPDRFPDKGAPAISAETWKEAATGLDYRYFHMDPGKDEDLKDFFVVRIDPERYSFEIYQNPDKDSALTIKEIHETTGSLLTVNGGFFTEDFKPTGLLISKGERIRAASSADLLDGIFAVDSSGNARLFGNTSEIDEKEYPFAVQNGPVLLDEKGKIMFDKETGKTASRTAIGLDKDGNVTLIILKPSLLDPDNHITLYGFAKMLKESAGFAELGLHSVLNLDGGPSTGLMIDKQYFPELDSVQNVIIVKERTI